LSIMEEHGVIANPEQIFGNVNNKISSVRDAVHEAIKSAILTNAIPPGSRLNERMLSKQMGVSTTPIKEALRRLELEGLVVTHQRKGCFVSTRVMTSIKEITWVRSALEGVSARLAAIKITEYEMNRLTSHIDKMKAATERKDSQELLQLNAEFHQRIRQSAKNDYLLQQINAIREYDNFVRNKALIVEDELDRAFNEHYKIYQMIMARDPDWAEEAMVSHIHGTLTRLTGDDRDRSG